MIVQHGVDEVLVLGTPGRDRQHTVQLLTNFRLVLIGVIDFVSTVVIALDLTERTVILSALGR